MLDAAVHQRLALTRRSAAVGRLCWKCEGFGGAALRNASASLASRGRLLLRLRFCLDHLNQTLILWQDLADAAVLLLDLGAGFLKGPDSGHKRRVGPPGLEDDGSVGLDADGGLEMNQDRNFVLSILLELRRQKEEDELSHVFCVIFSQKRFLKSSTLENITYNFFMFCNK